MSDIDAMQGRIMAALDRIGQGLDGLSQDTGDTELEGLRQQLKDETLANAHLEEHVKKLTARTCEAEEAARRGADAHAMETADREAAQKERGQVLQQLDDALQSLRKANQQLRDNNAALRAANAEGVADPHLINQSMMAELDGLRAACAADRAEMDVLLTELAQITAASDGADTESPNTGSESAARMEDV
ncbi:hypothetical protein [Roseovarius sp. M141]|uniref:hypothetical protein n=1 Tax=Roseovarius sp. M141 TaxID=2583806 RepID=UPI0020CD32EE|nr:hypothetical protein [Roseovarius sp. M141]MCQ0092865.1 hypothetical protein [Roseovarius sp. M141]